MRSLKWVCTILAVIGAQLVEKNVGPSEGRLQARIADPQFGGMNCSAQACAADPMPPTAWNRARIRSASMLRMMNTNRVP